MNYIQKYNKYRIKIKYIGGTADDGGATTSEDKHGIKNQRNI